MSKFLTFLFWKLVLADWSLLGVWDLVIGHSSGDFLTRLSFNLEKT